MGDEPMKALILAAGKGTRLKQLTTDRPKPMLEVGGEPLLARHIRSLRQAGVTQIAINLHHAPAVIVDYFGDGAGFGVQIVYSFEPELLGTAGAAKLLAAFLDEPFFVVYGDGFTNVDLAQLARVHTAQKARTGAAVALTMALFHVPNPTECGLVELTDAGRVKRFVEKPPPDQCGAVGV
jgi:NDP-sugar pyrophosphorylase family protein